ncbi:putative disease resistance protein RGA4 [Abrus precatorius]|uniref:Disease resistance protein RGA4 n=1 Tax=Abrus precatorius TaxID=3816 RepID=A0A8B8M2P6_ABRPR|nr:putative disease resistance protein RGA4 [Abrus precatorius]
MAEAVLDIVLENISSLVQKKLGPFLGFHQDLERLASLLSAIKATLEDAEEKQYSNRAIKDWLRKLKDAAYVLDDILDECATEALQLENHRITCGLLDKVQTSCLSSFHPKHVVSRYKIAKKMNRISERLDEIAEERAKFHLSETVRERKTVVIDWRQTTSIISQPQVFGREEDKDKIVDFLVVHASHFEDLSVYPIVGLGGLGKTTLAQLIFNHERVVNQFELRIWVCVSEDFSLKRMTKAIIEAAFGRACEDLDLEPLQRRLQDLLQRKRYLLVLDDVWDDDQENWHRLKSVLACGAKGASVLVTSRLQMVASIMGTTSPHDLSKLSNNDCWELFKQRAFEPNAAERAELVVIGKEIVNKCGGVPLAAIALGSLLRFKKEEKEWLYVKESKLWNIQDGNLVMPALRLSYLNLPVKLRQCFAFCAIFPKDEIISKQHLIELWMANGFISSNEILDAEDVGDEAWNELHWRSFFQDIQRDQFGKVSSFKMHDLVHDLAQSISEEVCCIHDNSCITTQVERIRHLLIYRLKLSDEASPIQLNQFKSLKTYVMPKYHAYQLPVDILKCYSLRVLERERLDSLQPKIGQLKYLRYLNISHGNFRTLPESICELLNLEILKLDHCHDLQRLPINLARLRALQHLSLRFCHILSSLARHMGMMTSLRTLSMYIIGNKRGFLLTELGRLNLKGKLLIKHLERVKRVGDAQEANMSTKQLNSLWLSWDRNEESELQENDEQILEVLQPRTQQLQTLSVEGYKGSHFPRWMSSPSLTHLNRLELVDCNNCLQLPQLGKLPSLKSLYVCKMIHMIHLYEESYDGGVVFVALEFLLLQKLPKLMRLSREDGENMFPRLSRFQITDCPELLDLPSLPSINDLRIKGKCREDLLSSIHKLNSLQSLSFNYNEELTCLPEGMLQNLTSLKKLEFYELSKLEILATRIINLNAIQELYISHSSRLKSLGDESLMEGLSSLKKLEIVECSKFNMSAGFKYLTCLEDLNIGKCEEMECLDEALPHMTALQSLSLWDLPNLQSLPDCFGNLALLRELGISNCPKLMCLPMSIKCLSGLKTLEIYRCPELEKRCEKEAGEDWSKIAHIPFTRSQNIRLGYGYNGGGYYVYCRGSFWIKSDDLEIQNLMLPASNV